MLELLLSANKLIIIYSPKYKFISLKYGSQRGPLGTPWTIWLTFSNSILKLFLKLIWHPLQRIFCYIINPFRINCFKRTLYNFYITPHMIFAVSLYGKSPKHQIKIKIFCHLMVVYFIDKKFWSDKLNIHYSTVKFVVIKIFWWYFPTVFSWYTFFNNIFSSPWEPPVWKILPSRQIAMLPHAVIAFSPIFWRYSFKHSCSLF